ncbi:MAG: cysteine desulfurase family protein [Phycisphaerales bacterium]
MIDLDHNATTRPSPAVIHAVTSALADHWHNPSSVHRAGQSARRQVELARAAIADLVAADPKEIVFTSSGTEAIDLAIRGSLAAFPHADAPPVVVSTAIEHAAVRDLLADLAKRGQIELRLVPVSREGIIDLAALAPLLDRASLCSIQWANNETGAIQPVAEIARLCQDRGIICHSDATQWIGKEPVLPTPSLRPSVPSSLPDLLSFAPHKFHGPKGVGVLRIRRGISLRPTLLGSQELGRRGGTENVPGIVGAGVAAREALAFLADPSLRDRQASLRDRFESLILTARPDAVINGPREPRRRLWNTSNIGFPRLQAEALLLMLSERGVCASAGAACSSGSLEPSPVLLAMAIPPEIALGSLRFSIGRDTTAAETDAAAAIVIDCVTRLAASL